MLKPLADAERDGDVVRAVIRNTGANQDGKTSGITFPSCDAQTRLMKSVYESAGIDPLETDYVEAHGTGIFFYLSSLSLYSLEQVLQLAILSKQKLLPESSEPNEKAIIRFTWALSNPTLATWKQRVGWLRW